MAGSLGEEASLICLRQGIQTGETIGQTVLQMVRTLGNAAFNTLDGLNAKLQSKNAAKESPENETEEVLDGDNTTLNNDNQHEEILSSSQPNIRVMSLGELADNADYASIDISEMKDMKTFRSMLRKYDVDASVRVDNSSDPPTCCVFFKTTDNERLKEALSDYANLNRDGTPKPMKTKGKDKPSEAIKNIQEEQKEERERNKVSERGIRTQERGVIPR